MSEAVAERASTSGAIALSALVDRAVAALTNARSAAEVLEARDLASFAYDAAKKAARLGKAKRAHDELISAAYRAQADALEIEAAAKRRLADEYDAAQERGEVQTVGGDRVSNVPKQNNAPTASEIGLSRKDIHEARIIRDAENADPGIVRRTVNAAIDAGEEPSKAKVRRAVLETARPQTAARSTPQPARGRDASISRVRESVVGLCGLPRPAEVAGWLRESDASIIIDERIENAASWLNEFAEAWRSGGC